MKLTRLFSFFFVLLIFSHSQIWAQDNIHAINLESALKAGGANNLTIQQYQLEYKRSVAELKKSQEWWLPDLYAGTRLHKRTGTAMNADGFFYTDINRQFFWGGIGLDFEWDFGNGVYKSKAEKLAVQSMHYKSQAERNQALLKIINSYYDFLAAQLYYQSYEQLVEQGDSISDQIKVQVQAGIRYESELLLSLSNQSRLKVEMLNAKIEFYKKSAQLVRMLNLPANTKLISIDSLLIPLTITDPESEIEMNDSIYLKRPEISAADYKLKSLVMEKRTTTTALLIPTLKIGGFTSMFGDVFSPTYPTNSLNASLIWKIPTGRLTYAGDLKKFRADIAIQENRLNQIKTEVTEEVILARDIMKITKLQMDVSLEGSKLAEQALIQGIQRERLGTMRPFEVIQSQEIFIRMRLDYLKSVATHNKAQYQLLVALGNNL